MSALEFDKLDPSSRLWIYGASKELDEASKTVLADIMNSFTAGWNAHQAPVLGGWTLLYDRFVLIGADESMTAVSGCSIDSMSNCLRDFESRTGNSFMANTGNIFYRDTNNAVQCVNRPEFKKLAEENKIDENTTVFDNTILSVSDYINGKWELPIKESWHFKLFPKVSIQ